MEQIFWTQGGNRDERNEVGCTQERGPGSGLHLGQSEAPGMAGLRRRGERVFPFSILCFSRKRWAGCSHADPSGLYQGGEVRGLASGTAYCCQVAG